MAKKLSSVLGIDIGSRKIKIAEVKGGKEPTISALGMIDTPEGAVDHTGVYNSEAVGAALKQLIGQSGVSVSHVVVSIAGQASVLVRTLEVPRMNATELAEHMQWEINRNIPFAESNVFSDFKPLEDEDPSSPNMDVVMAIAPQSAIDALLTAIKKAGKQIAAIDVQPLGLARSLRTSYEEEYRDMTICAVDVGHKTTSINIYKDGKLLMPRQVPVGGEMFTKAISDALGIGMEEAELLKQQKCFVSSGLLQSSVDDAFGFGLPPAAAPGQTQEFTPYNPFADDNVPMAPPSPSHSLPQPPPLDLAATPAEYDPEMVAPFDSTPFSTNPTFGEPEQEPLAPPHASHDPYANHGDDTLLPPPPAAEHPLEPAPASSLLKFAGPSTTSRAEAAQ